MGDLTFYAVKLWKAGDSVKALHPGIFLAAPYHRPGNGSGNKKKLTIQTRCNTLVCTPQYNYSLHYA